MEHGKRKILSLVRHAAAGASKDGSDIPSWKDAGLGKGRLLWFKTP